MPRHAMPRISTCIPDSQLARSTPAFFHTCVPENRGLNSRASWPQQLCADAFMQGEVGGCTARYSWWRPGCPSDGLSESCRLSPIDRFAHCDAEGKFPKAIHMQSQVGTLKASCPKRYTCRAKLGRVLGTLGSKRQWCLNVSVSRPVG
eukprot:195543-Chlamydomonas_euryale.AAC.1